MKFDFMNIPMYPLKSSKYTLSECATPVKVNQRVHFKEETNV
jgi:hypothetical protein